MLAQRLASRIFGALMCRSLGIWARQRIARCVRETPETVDQKVLRLEVFCTRLGPLSSPFAASLISPHRSLKVQLASPDAGTHSSAG